MGIKNMRKVRRIKARRTKARRTKARRTKARRTKAYRTKARRTKARRTKARTTKARTTKKMKGGWDAFGVGFYEDIGSNRFEERVVHIQEKGVDADGEVEFQYTYPAHVVADFSLYIMLPHEQEKIIDEMAEEHPDIEIATLDILRDSPPMSGTPPGGRRTIVTQGALQQAARSGVYQGPNTPPRQPGPHPALVPPPLSPRPTGLPGGLSPGGLSPGGLSPPPPLSGMVW